MNRTILGREIEVLERIEQHGPLPGHWYKIKSGDKIRIAPAKYLEDEFWK